jgi:hypothetical protein
MARRLLDSTDPKYVRGAMHTSYERYIAGIDIFPRLHVAPQATPEHFPRKTQGIAEALIRAWRGIREDREYFGETAQMLVNRSEAYDGEEPFRGLSIVRMGRNAVGMAMVTDTPEEGIQVFAETARTKTFMERFGGLVVRVGGDQAIKIADNIIAANPGIMPAAVIVRENNASAFFMADRTATSL